jgi:septum formation protein
MVPQGLEKAGMKLILASASPRRAEILRHAGFTFDIHAVRVDESQLPDERPADYVRRLASAKARLAAEHATQNGERAMIIAADTVISLGRQILGKPSDADDARRMLRLLSGKTHQVLTGLSIVQVPAGPEALHVETTHVTFMELSEKDVEEYVATGEPLGKAGAYAIQGIAGRFITRIEGCYFNVVGLPLACLWSSLRASGWDERRHDGGC